MTQQNHSGSGHNIMAETGDIYIDTMPKLLSDLSLIVNLLSKKIYETDDKPLITRIPFNPETKIQFNNVRKFKYIIDRYKMFVGKLSPIYSEFDKLGTNKTHIVLENISLKYIKAKAILIDKHPDSDEMDLIRQHSDSLIEIVESELLNEIKKSSNVDTTIESINICVQIILIDAFIRCNILEEPV